MTPSTARRRAARLAGLAAATLGLACALGSPFPRASSERDEWEAVVARVARSVVVLRVSTPRPFDGEPATTSVATGFVVDAERGLILTNRHVVNPGPIRADAVFLDREEVEVRPVYRDPVHDFGFLQYDPAKVRFQKPVALPLAPEAARVGTEIRVIGNDSGEQLSILAGTLARLDREAPDYGRGRYNDFNTFYLQAASSASGGSSGSPVVDREGRAVALNAGGRRSSASSFFLPLDRVVRALRYVQDGASVPRGTLQSVFRFQPFDELRRLGLRAETEAAVRAASPHATGMLVVDQVLPGGPADGVLEPGDILVSAGGEPARSFVALESLLDDHVGQTVGLAVERGGSPLERELRVDDLHAITPDAYLEAGGAVLHQLSYEQARGFDVPVGGVYLASGGYSFTRAGIPAGVVITALDGQPMPDLATFERALAAQPHDAPVNVRFHHLALRGNPSLAVLRLDRRFFPMRHCQRDDHTGLWPCTPLPPAPPPEPIQPATTGISAEGPPAVRALAPSLVLVHFDVPVPIDGVQGRAFTGTGLVVDAERGLVVVDRDTVPVTLGDVQLVFGGTVEVPGQVRALHPEHNLAVVSYDPALLGDTPVRSAVFDTRPLAPGDEVWQVSVTQRNQVLGRRTQVARIEAPSIPIPPVPRFRDANLELVLLDEPGPGVGGALTDARGRVRASWVSFSTPSNEGPGAFFAGIPADLVLDLVRPLRAGEPFVWHSVGVEWEELALADARSRGLGNAQARALAAHDPERRRALSVRWVERGGPADGVLEVGDLLVSVDGRSVTRFREVERAAQRGPVALGIVRDGAERALTIAPRAVAEGGAERFALWAGAILQDPPRTLAQQRGAERSGVYIAATLGGTPAERYGLAPVHRILAVDDVPTPDLESLLAAVAGRPDASSVRLRMADLEGRVEVQTLVLDLHYWPTATFHRSEKGWVRD